MADKKAEAKDNEKIFTIPLRTAYKKSHENRSPYATKMVRDFLRRHAKADTVKLGPMLNETIWARGIKKPPARVRVKAVMEDGVLKAELVGHEYREFRAAPKKERKGAKEKLLERLGPKAIQKEEEEKKIEGKDKEEAKAEKAEAKHEHKAEAKAEAKESPGK